MKKVSFAVIAALIFASSISALDIQKFPKSGDMYGMINPADPYRTVISGLFRQTVKVGTADRTFLVYIAKDNAQYQPGVVIVPDSGQNGVAFLEKSGWKEIADANGMILVIAESPDGKWDRDRDLVYLDRVYTVSHNREWYNLQKGNNYLAAYGDASSVAQSWAMKTPANFGSFATFGDVAVSADFMKKAGEAPSELAYIPVKEIPMPVWMFVPKMTADAEALLRYWKYSNKADGDMLSDANATGIYLAKANSIDTLLDEQDTLAQTRYTIVSDADAISPERTKTVWKFLSSVIRPVGLANGDLRAARSAQDWGIVRRTIVVDGITRYWLEFVPARLRATAPGKAPLVVYSHGGSNTAEAIVDRTELIKFANERGFIAAFPTGALTKSATSMPSPTWNTPEDPAMWDDYKFMRAMTGDIVSRLPVDAGRMYLAGQSMGGMNTLACSLRLNDLYAAGYSNAAFLIQSSMNLMKSPKILNGNKMPILIIIGERDQSANLDIKNIEPNLSYWITRSVVGSFGKPSGVYKDGRYNFQVWSDGNGVPLVKYAIVDEKPHTPLPSDIFIGYDDFLSKYSRGADGTLYYMGAAVK